MTELERMVRAAAYRLIREKRLGPTSKDLAAEVGASDEEVRDALRSLQDQHLLASDENDGRVVMAHPFSGVATGYRATVGEDWWFANCAWDALAILALVGDGKAEIDDRGQHFEWTVAGGEVDPPEAMIHLLVPAAQFWNDIGFT